MVVTVEITLNLTYTFDILLTFELSCAISNHHDLLCVVLKSNNTPKLNKSTNLQ